MSGPESEGTRYIPGFSNPANSENPLHDSSQPGDYVYSERVIANDVKTQEPAAVGASNNAAAASTRGDV